MPRENTRRVLASRTGQGRVLVSRLSPGPPRRPWGPTRVGRGSGKRGPCGVVPLRSALGEGGPSRTPGCRGVSGLPAAGSHLRPPTPHLLLSRPQRPCPSVCLLSPTPRLRGPGFSGAAGAPILTVSKEDAASGTVWVTAVPTCPRWASPCRLPHRAPPSWGSGRVEGGGEGERWSPQAPALGPVLRVSQAEGEGAFPVAPPGGQGRWDAAWRGCVSGLLLRLGSRFAQL